MRTRHFAAFIILAALAVALAACAGPSTTIAHETPPVATGTAAAPIAAPASTATSDTTTPPITSGTSGYQVNVFFSRHPDSENNPASVFAVTRTSPTLGVATFAIKQLIAGPTAAERNGGLYTPLTVSLTGPSSCGADFTLALNTHASRPEPGTATLRFCRATQLAGDLTGAYIKAEINRTLLQFPSIKKVVILTSSGRCFDDLSGQNLCLK